MSENAAIDKIREEMIERTRVKNKYGSKNLLVFGRRESSSRADSKVERIRCRLE